MKYLIAFIVVISLSACGKQNNNEFQNYQDAFARDAAKNGVLVVAGYLEVREVDATVDLNAIESQDLGLRCEGRGPKSYLSIDMTIWNSLSPERKEFSMYHELGHCLLDKRHPYKVNTTYAELEPTAIMGLKPYADADYDSKREALVTELFQGSAQ